MIANGRSGVPVVPRMTRTPLGCALFLTLAVGSLHAGSGGRIVWETDLLAARERAQAQGKPLMIYFSGET